MADSVITGRVWKFGPDINTDLVIPNYAVLFKPDDMPPHCFVANRPGWVDEVKPGDIMLTGTNFGVGSGRPIGDVFVRLGIAAIVLESFNGLGLRNCINVGIPVLSCPGVLDIFEEGDIAEVAWTEGTVKNTTQGKSISAKPFPKALQDIVNGGGVEDILRAEGYMSNVSRFG